MAPFHHCFTLYRVPIFQASNAYLYLRGNGLKMSFEFVKDMPRAAIPAVHNDRFDLAPYIGQLPFVWTMELLFPVRQAFVDSFCIANMNWMI